MKRTLNILNMSVTLDVSQLSGWLNADAYCRVEGEGMRCGGERWEPGSRRACVRCGGGTTSGMHGEKARLKAWGPRARAERHLEHAAHGRDAGGVQAQRLVEGRRELPSRREGMRCGGERCEPGGGRACGVVAAHKRQGMHGEKARLKAWGPRARRGAHLEDVAHVSDAGGVKAQRLVEGRRALPSRREGMRCRGERGASREAGGPVVWWRHDKRHARGMPDSRLGGQGHAWSAR